MRSPQMVRSLCSFVLTLILILPAGQELDGQTTTSKDTLLAVARDIMDAARYCGLITTDATGITRVRTMDPFSPESDMTIWMGTNRETRKVKEIEGDPRVTLYYAAPDASGYVSISGTASLVDEEEEKAARWKPEWEAFYQDRASEYLLVRVTPLRLEVIDYSRGIVGGSETWEPPTVFFTNGASELSRGGR